MASRLSWEDLKALVVVLEEEETMEMPLRDLVGEVGVMVTSTDLSAYLAGDWGVTARAAASMLLETEFSGGTTPTSAAGFFNSRLFEYRSGFCRANVGERAALDGVTWSRMSLSSGRSILSSAPASSVLVGTSFFIRVVRPLNDLWGGWALSRRELSPRFGRILKLLSLLRWNPSGLSLRFSSLSGALSDTLSSSNVYGDEHGVKRRSGERGGCTATVGGEGVARPVAAACGRRVDRKAAARNDLCCLWSRLVMVNVEEEGS